MTKHYYNLDNKYTYYVIYRFEKDIILKVPLNYKEGATNSVATFNEYWWYRIPEPFEDLDIESEEVVCLGYIHNGERLNNIIVKFTQLLKSGDFEDDLEETNADGSSKKSRYNKGLYDMANKIGEWWFEQLK